MRAVERRYCWELVEQNVVRLNTGYLYCLVGKKKTQRDIYMYTETFVDVTNNLYLSQLVKEVGLL